MIAELSNDGPTEALGSIPKLQDLVFLGLGGRRDSGVNDGTFHSALLSKSDKKVIHKSDKQFNKVLDNNEFLETTDLGVRGSNPLGRAILLATMCGESARQHGVLAVRHSRVPAMPQSRPLRAIEARLAAARKPLAALKAKVA